MHFRFLNYLHELSKRLQFNRLTFKTYLKDIFITFLYLKRIYLIFNFKIVRFPNCSGTGTEKKVQQFF